MALVSSGSQILLKGTGDTNPSGQTFYLDTTITSASTSLQVKGFTRTQENSDVFYTAFNTLTGTIYGYKTSQTTEYNGTNRLARGFDDTNPSVNFSSGAVLGSGFMDDIGWFGNTPAGGLGGTWWTAKGVVGISLGTDENSLGSISTQSYTGGGSVGTLEVHNFGWFNNSSNTYPNGTVLNTQGEGNWIMLLLKNTSASPPDSNDSFYSVIINGQEFLRTDASVTTSQASNAANDSNVSSGTHYYRTWLWSGADVTDSDLSAIGTTGSKTFKLTQGASSTLNTGISEEMSGNTDTDPIEFSDYYKAGTFHNTTGIPTSGEIKFSEFYGKTRTPLVSAIMGATITNGHDSGQYHFSNGFNGISAIGSATGTSLSGTVGGQTGCIMSSILNTNGILYFQYIKSGFSGSFTNTGWTTLKVYLGQSNNSGSADLTLARTAFSFTSTNGIAYYSYNGSSPSVGSPSSTASGAIFGASGGTHFIEII